MDSTIAISVAFIWSAGCVCVGYMIAKAKFAKKEETEEQAEFVEDSESEEFVEDSESEEGSEEEVEAEVVEDEKVNTGNQ